MKRFALICMLLSTNAFANQTVNMPDGTTIELDSRIQIDQYDVNENYFINAPNEAFSNWSFPRVKRDVKICASSVSLYAWQVPTCVSTFASAIAVCTTAVSGVTAPACGGLVLATTFTCGISIGAAYGIVEGCITGK